MKESILKSIALGYHDVVEELRREPSAERRCPANYALDRLSFRDHLEAILRRVPRASIRTIERQESWGELWPVFLTFDDGAIGAYDCVAPELELHGLRGHFFITTDWLGKPGFVSTSQIVDLRRRGHVIGSHTCSHPERMSHLGNLELAREWSRSSAILSDLLGEPITVASVPDGYYSQRVGQSAAEAGIRVLFNSEPTAAVSSQAGMLVLGRYAIFAATPPAVAAGLAAGSKSLRSRQWALWQVKKGAKAVGGEAYLSLRRRVLGSMAERDKGREGFRHV